MRYLHAGKLSKLLQSAVLAALSWAARHVACAAVCNTALAHRVCDAVLSLCSTAVSSCARAVALSGA